MPKLVTKNPKLGKNGIYAVVRYKGKTHQLGKHGTPEALTAYNRFCVELQTNPAFLVPKNERDITLDEVAAAYLEYANRRFGKTEYGHYRTALSFAVEIYGDQSADAFSYQNLRTVRNEMIRSGRFCRDMINKYIGRIRTAFSWGVETLQLPTNMSAFLSNTFNGCRGSAFQVNDIFKFPVMTPTQLAVASAVQYTFSGVTNPTGFFSTATERTCGAFGIVDDVCGEKTWYSLST